MAKMIPPYISDDVKSAGERLLFQYFENDPGASEWFVLHSLGLAKHVKKMYGEIDFVVVAPNLGIFCLEVKSGSVSRKNGIWEFTNRYGEVSRKTRGPFEQAQEGMFSLVAAVKRSYSNSKFTRFLFGYGVMFPHILFDLEGLDHEPWKIYDRDSRRRPISDYIKSLAYHERKKAENESWFDSKISIPSHEDAEELVRFLRGDFERLVAVRHLQDDREEALIRFTEEQFKCLDQLKANKRCLFTGAAGTGKTLIALESARRAGSEHNKVAMFCFNKMLGNWLSIECKKMAGEEIAFVGTFHKFMLDIAKKSQLLDVNSNDVLPKEFYTEDLPLMALQAIDQGSITPFDSIIIDEGQDLIRPEYLDVFDAMLKGGLAGGKWQLFCDFERQAIYSELNSDQMLELIEQRSSFASFNLTINCRNTRQVGEETALITGFEVPPFLPSKLEGPPVEYMFYENSDSETTMIDNILEGLKGQKVPMGRVTMLSPYQFTKSSASGIDKSKYQVFDLSLHPEKLYGSSLTFSTVHSYKGLENSIILLCDISRLNDDDIKSILYVGMTRAKDRLYVLVNATAKVDYYKLLKRSIT